MPDQNHESTSLLVKISIYIFGVILGIGAKLATMHKQKKLTMTDAIVEFLIAAAAAFVVWSFFHYKLKEDDLAIIMSVIAGRYGDDIILKGWQELKKLMSRLGNNTDKE